MKNKINLLIVLISLVVISTATAADKISVLHISAFGSGELQYIIDKAKTKDLFQVDEVLLDDGLPENWFSYDVLVFGLSDCYETSVGKEAPDIPELKLYVQSGGGIVWTHDTLEYGRSWGNDVEIPAGVAEKKAERIGMHNGKIRIAKDHEILYNVFDMGLPGDVLQTTQFKGGYSHSGQGVVTTADIIIEHKENPAPNNFYLTVNKYGSGRVVVNEIGHSVIGSGGAFNPEINDVECKLLVNSIWWAGHGKTGNSIFIPREPYTLVPDETKIIPVKGRAVSWKSLNPKIATVDNYGRVRARKTGFATIVVTDENGTQDSISVFVNKKRLNPLNRTFGALKLPVKAAKH